MIPDAAGCDSDFVSLADSRTPSTFAMRNPFAERWWHPFTEIDRIVIEHVDLTRNAKFEAHALTWLNDQELERWQKFLFPGPKRRFALCRAALRKQLCERLGCSNEQLTFEESQHGKPSAAVHGRIAPISFNVSHSGNHGLLAFAPSGRIGVDVEERVYNRHIDLLCETVLGPNERTEIAQLRDQEKIEMFFHLWTVKEALIKALGVGISLDTSGFEVPLDMRRGAKREVFEFPHLPGVMWRIEDLSTEQFAAALAYEA